MNKDKLNSIVNSSGFPLQIAIENEVKTNTRNWNVISKEHPWKTIDSHNEGFIDLIIGIKNQKMVIECKRVKESDWVFLCSTEDGEINNSQFWWTHCKQNKLENFDWIDGYVIPPSYQSSFCAIQGQDKKKPLLESICAELIEATEAFAIEEHIMLSKEGVPRYSKMYVPVIITTAELHICKLNPADISMKTGEIKESEFLSVPFVRFRKSLSNFPFWRERPFVPDTYKFTRIEEIAAAKERTVFVIHAPQLNEVLESWDLRFPIDY